jgi:hypothetical protein
LIELNARGKYLKKNTEISISSEILTKRNCVDINNVYKMNICVGVILRIKKFKEKP